MKIVRLVLLLLVGGICTYFTYKSKYQAFFFYAIIHMIFVLLGLVLFIWALIKDLENFHVNRQLKNLLLTGIATLFIIINLTAFCQIQRNFHKPTLLKAYYDGDFNSVGIDFKTDGTYIIADNAVGLSEYLYGTYHLTLDTFILHTGVPEDIILTSTLKIQRVIDTTGLKDGQYLYQIGQDGNILPGATEFRVTVDNRK